MIIAFYPGAGGNRYLRMLQNLDWKDSNQIFDLKNNQEYKYRYLFEDTDIVVDNSEYILTHCLNAPHILKNFPNHDILFIIGNFKKCLQREWVLAGHNRYINKQINDDVSRIDHYYAIKDATWPDCYTIADINNLPKVILNEVNKKFKDLVKINLQNNILAELEKDALSKVNSSYESIMWHKNYYLQYPMDFGCYDVIDISVNSSEFAGIMRQELDLYQSEIFNKSWDKINEQ